VKIINDVRKNLEKNVTKDCDRGMHSHLPISPFTTSFSPIYCSLLLLLQRLQLLLLLQLLEELLCCSIS